MFVGGGLLHKLSLKAGLQDSRLTLYLERQWKPPTSPVCGRLISDIRNLWAIQNSFRLDVKKVGARVWLFYK